MKSTRPTLRTLLHTALAALIIAVLAVWRLPVVLGQPQDSLIFAGSAMSIVLVAALFLLIRHAFGCEDARLNRTVYSIGLIFSAFTLVGKQVEANSGLLPLSWASALDGLFLWALYAVVYGAALLLIFQTITSLTQRAAASARESLFSRILGNYFFVFALLLLCWIPVWLAFWPGTFVYDSGTQFYTYYDWVHNTHHPLLHTLLLGFCIVLGIDITPEGDAAVGLAIYSIVQMVLMAGLLAYACRWMRRRGAPLAARVFVTLLFAIFPFYGIWSFSAQKDILFGALAMVFILQLMDLWRDGYAALRSAWRIAGFILTATLMMLMRNNGIYALILFIPFALLWAKGARLRMAAVLAGCAAVYFAVNGALIWATEAVIPCKIELLSIPLQQIARTLRDNPSAIDLDTDQVLDTLYDVDLAEIYAPAVADPVKWTAYYDEVDANLPKLLSLWARMGVQNVKTYLEAFLVQNLPYFLPGARMIYRFDLGVVQIDLFYIQEHSYLPGLQSIIKGYDNTLTLFGLPGIRLLSDTAFYVWLCIAGFGYAIYRRKYQWMSSFVFLLAIWISCLVGPVAIIRYMLAFFYAIPVMLAVMLAPEGKPALPATEEPATGEQPVAPAEPEPPHVTTPQP